METHLPRCFSNNIKEKTVPKNIKIRSAWISISGSNSPSEMTASHSRNLGNVLGVATPLKEKIENRRNKKSGKKKCGPRQGTN